MAVTVGAAGSDAEGFEKHPGGVNAIGTF